MSKFSKAGIKREIVTMEKELEKMQKDGLEKQIQFQALRQELNNVSLDIETKMRTIKDLQIRFGFKTEKDFLPQEEPKK